MTTTGAWLTAENQCGCDSRCGRLIRSILQEPPHGCYSIAEK